jgi:creatinine amidohydrolase
MTWPEFRSALEKVEIALIPVGSTEQHGPHGTFGVDAGRAAGFARLLGAKLYPRAVVAPLLPYGVSPHHMKFPGTITLDPETFLHVCEQIVDSLHQHGLRKFFFINGHGGNRPALSMLMQRLMVKYEDSRCGWTSFTSLARTARAKHVLSPITGHACEGEMSQALILAPWTFRKEAAVAGDLLVERGFKVEGIEVPQRFDILTRNGALGDATKASETAGEEIVQEALEAAYEYLIRF